MNHSSSKHHCSYIFFGPPGAGKGTLAHKCVEELGYLQLSTGDLFRKHQAEGTEIGKQIDFAMNSGTLIDDNLVIDIVKQWLEEHESIAQGFLFDGFPRTVTQAKLFLEMFARVVPEMKLMVVQLIIDDEKVVERIISRRVCSNKDCQAVFSMRVESLGSKIDGVCDVCGSKLIQREDDKRNVVSSRLMTYHRHSQGLIDFFEKSGILIKKLNADMPFDEVFEKFIQLMEDQP